MCPNAQRPVCPLPHLPPGSVCWGALGALGSQHWVLPRRGLLGVPQCTTPPCPPPHLLPGSVCWGALGALGSQHWAPPRRGLLGVPQCTAPCAPTTPPVARQRVLGHAKGPWQLALGATPPGPAKCAPVHDTLRTHYPTCCPAARVGARQGPLAANTGCYPAGACWVCPSAWHFACPLPHSPPGSVCWGALGALGS